jgi:hypothetical protein
VKRIPWPTSNVIAKLAVAAAAEKNKQVTERMERPVARPLVSINF